jgi:hypothetical protein
MGPPEANQPHSTLTNGVDNHMTDALDSTERPDAQFATVGPIADNL